MDTDHFNQIQKESGWSKELLYQLVDNVKDYAIFVSDLDGGIVSWNAGAVRIFGYQAQEVIGQQHSILFTPYDRANKEPEKELQTARTEGCAEDERWHVRKDGSFFFASGVQTPLYDEAGKHTGYAKIARDLTERITLEKELREERDNLEFKVERRTSELKDAHESLRLENIERQRSEEARAGLLQQIISTQEDERKRIARDLHDNLGQQLVALKLNLEVLQEQCVKDPVLCERIEKTMAIAKQLDSEVDFIAWELRPSALDSLGLVKAQEAYVKEWSYHYRIQAEFQCRGLDGKRLQPDIEVNLYRIVQEALNNVMKHAEANKVSVLQERVGSNLVLIIEDDGKGFDPAEKEKLTKDDRGMGLLGMKERAALIGGTLEIESAPGAGTTIYARVPARFVDKTEN